VHALRCAVLPPPQASKRYLSLMRQQEEEAEARIKRQLAEAEARMKDAVTAEYHGKLKDVS
jgi:hypothetical protein